MRSLYILTMLLFLISAELPAQAPRYLFNAVNEQPAADVLLVHYGSGVGHRSVQTFGQNGLEQAAGATIGITDKVTLSAHGGLLFHNRRG